MLCEKYLSTLSKPIFNELFKRDTYLLILLKLDDKGKRFKELVHETGLSEKAVSEALVWLTNHGLVEKDQRLLVYKLSNIGLEIKYCLELSYKSEDGMFDLYLVHRLLAELRELETKINKLRECIKSMIKKQISLCRELCETKNETLSEFNFHLEKEAEREIRSIIEKARNLYEFLAELKKRIGKFVEVYSQS